MKICLERKSCINTRIVIEANFPNDYPFKPPKFKLKTDIYHPSVKKNKFINQKQFDRHGGWTPAFFIQNIFYKILKFEIFGKFENFENVLFCISNGTSTRRKNM